jgi:hypothetical protein
VENIEKGASTRIWTLVGRVPLGCPTIGIQVHSHRLATMYECILQCENWPYLTSQSLPCLVYILQKKLHFCPNSCITIPLYVSFVCAFALWDLGEKIHSPSTYVMMGRCVNQSGCTKQTSNVCWWHVIILSDCMALKTWRFWIGREKMRSCERACSLVVTRALVAPQVLDSTPRGSEFLRI